MFEELSGPDYQPHPSLIERCHTQSVVSRRSATAPLVDLVNLAHLNALCEKARIGGHDMALVHIYAEPPNYAWVDAPGEGIACVDDVARAALVYLSYAEHYGNQSAWRQAQRCLEFVMYMQAEDGEYYNFVLDRRGTINRDGVTSYKDWGWWAGRGQWALAEGARAFRPRDAILSARLRAHYERGEKALEQKVAPHLGHFITHHGVKVPAWLIGDGTDVTALAMLGVASYQKAFPNERSRALLEHLGEAVASYRLGNARDYPFGAHPSLGGSLSRWHQWGSHQVHALAVAGHVLGRRDFISSARAEADSLFARMLAGEVITFLDAVPQGHEQIAYGQSVCVSGLMALADATGETRYARMAGLAASWFLGNNVARQPMYDFRTGRGYDGIDNVGGPHPSINPNSGAESTIEALWSLLCVSRRPEAAHLVRAMPVESAPRPAWLVIEAEHARVVAGTPQIGQASSGEEASYSAGGFVTLRPGDGMQLRLPVPSTAEYYLYASHLRTPGRSTLHVKLDGQPLAELDTGSPDTPYLWLDRLTPRPLRLDAGAHTLDFTAGQADACVVDAFVLQASRLSKVLRLPHGMVRVTYSVEDGELRISPLSVKSASLAE
jgi:hypothetical protein